MSDSFSCPNPDGAEYSCTLVTSPRSYDFSDCFSLHLALQNKNSSFGFAMLCEFYYVASPTQPATDLSETTKNAFVIVLPSGTAYEELIAPNLYNISSAVQQELRITYYQLLSSVNKTLTVSTKEDKTWLSDNTDKLETPSINPIIGKIALWKMGCVNGGQWVMSGGKRLNSSAQGYILDDGKDVATGILLKRYAVSCENMSAVSPSFVGGQARITFQDWPAVSVAETSNYDSDIRTRNILIIILAIFIAGMLIIIVYMLIHFHPKSIKSTRVHSHSHTH